MIRPQLTAQRTLCHFLNEKPITRSLVGVVVGSWCWAGRAEGVLVIWTIYSRSGLADVEGSRVAGAGES
jgi:hypothetical protein